MPSIRALLLIALPFFHSGPLGAEAAPSIRVGVLAFGTLSWELEAIRGEGLDRAQGIAIEAVPLASAEAGKIALLGSRVDLIVNDWLWAASERERGQDLVFYPYSASHGALIVPAGSPIHQIADLKGRRLGIAGGGLDKNWLLLRALAQKVANLDLDSAVDKVFAAPPLLDQQFRRGQLDAVLNYWNYAAKLEAAGYQKMLDGRQILRGLGITVEVPVLGYIFRKGFANAHPLALTGFLRAADQAKERICASDAVWQKLSPLTHEADETVRAALRRHYCEGRIKHFGAAEQAALGEIYALVQKAAGKPASGTLPQDLFWHQ